MNINAEMVAKQIKAFNKLFSRAADQLSNSAYETVTDLIGYDRMTKSGRGKAGKKFLESLSDDELLEYSSSISLARESLQMFKYGGELVDGILTLEDPKSALWRLYDRLSDLGYVFDSEQIKDLVDGEKDVDYRSVMANMVKMTYDEDYGLADFTDWFNNLPDLRK